MTKSRSIKIRAAGVAGIAAIGAALCFAADRVHKHRLADGYVQEIITLLKLPATSDFHRRVEKVRTFINDNSVHKIDQAFWAINTTDRAAFAAGLLAHAKGLSNEPVHMECSSRSHLMARILGALGYETRIIDIFDSRTNLQSHTFLEVMNPKTKRWETQDPDYDIYWRHKKSRERISVADSAEAIGDIEPCGRERCGWDHASRERIRAKKLKSYLDVISITEMHGKVRYALYTSRADLSATYSQGLKRGTFCQVAPKRCAQGFFDIAMYSTLHTGTAAASSSR